MWGASYLSLGRASTLAFAIGRSSPSSCRGVSSPLSFHVAVPYHQGQQQHAYSTSTALEATQYLLRYDYIPDVLEKRGPYREGHLGLAKQLIAEGRCLSGGPTGDVGMEVPTGALFVFTDEEAAQLFVKEDPYVSGGIVTGHSIEEWNVVVSKDD